MMRGALSELRQQGQGALPPGSPSGPEAPPPMALSSGVWGLPAPAGPGQSPGLAYFTSSRALA